MRNFARSAFGSPVSRILLGSLIGQGTILAVSPLLTRLYSPSDFSAFAMITAFSAVLGGLVTLSWERAIVVPDQESHARDLLLLGLISTFILSSLLATIAFVWRHDLSAAFGSDVFRDFWWLTPCTILSIGVYALLSSWIVRQQRYSQLSARNAVQGLSQALSSVALGALGFTPLGLLTSLAVGRLSGTLGIAHRIVTAWKHPVRLINLRRTARQYRRFPLVNTWSRLANSLGLQLPIILLIAVYGSVETGLYALTIRVLASPIGIVVDATSQYFEGSFARIHREGVASRERLIKRFAGRMLLIGAVPALMALAFAPPVFRIVFGQEWERAGTFAQLVVFIYLAQFVVAPVSRALVIMGWQFTQLAWDLGRGATTVGAIVACSAVSAQFETCLIALSAVQVTAYVALYGLCGWAARRADMSSL